MRPVDRLSLNVGPALATEGNPAQYLDTVADPAATMTYGNRYLFGDLDQKTLSADIRFNCIFTPKLSLELFAQPLVSSSTSGASASWRRPGPTPSSPPTSTRPSDSYSFVSFRASAVLRWEYRPGSTVYLVWNQNQDTEEDASRLPPRPLVPVAARRPRRHGGDAQGELLVEPMIGAPSSAVGRRLRWRRRAARRTPTAASRASAGGRYSGSTAARPR